MKVLITGSAGFVGSHLVEHLLEKTDWEIIGLDSFSHRGDSLRVKENLRYQVYRCDLAAPISWRLIEKIGDVNFLVNMASMSHVDTSITAPAEFIQNNVNLSLGALGYARQRHPKMFIQVSTDEVYGAAPVGTHHAEWSPILPSNPYAASKACQEAIAISYWRTYGVSLVITNTMNMFGERQDPEKFIPMCISKILKGQTVSIHGNAHQIGSRFYLHARNFSDALLYLMQNHEPRQYEDNGETVFPDRFNVVGEIEQNNLEVALLISKILNKPLSHSFVDFHHARPGHDRRYALDGSKLLYRGWKQPVDFEHSLRKTVEWTMKHPEWLHGNASV